MDTTTIICQAQINVMTSTSIQALLSALTLVVSVFMAVVASNRNTKDRFDKKADKDYVDKQLEKMEADNKLSHADIRCEINTNEERSYRDMERTREEAKMLVNAVKEKVDLIYDILKK